MIKNKILSLLLCVSLFAVSTPQTFANGAVDPNPNTERVLTEKIKSDTLEIIENSRGSNSVQPQSEVRPANIFRIVMEAAKLLFGATKTYNKVTEAYVENAIENEFKDELPFLVTRNSLIEEFWLIGTNEYVELKFGTSDRGLEHILSKHHPKYWTGLGYREYNSFFNDTTSMRDIISIIAVVANQTQNNKNKIIANNSGNVSVDGTYDGKKYRLVVSSDYEVVTLYPLGWNVAESK
ncbi:MULTISPECIES: hypothetical protein [Paenibacillus]|uniref:Bacterial EndoU nuclease domain-containing protein n=1 Tax=Paenibacillus cucumis (ex Kampfer et al. 2016) TaxID=1776858 RepID=A0ABS7KFQ1_9BACL|nr:MULTISPECIES: hypothetical protein [Paenibacillus]MBY0202781.1 hypothetical protein [Paenibacillus cucumis (ex Kampfer et al. 2016)]MDP9700423.1 hypothetical protein [Paenibacillus intestini]